jgi:hypothetical protein
VKIQKYERVGWLKFKNFYEDNSQTVALRQIKFGAEKSHGHTYK